MNKLRVPPEILIWGKSIIYKQIMAGSHILETPRVINQREAVSVSFSAPRAAWSPSPGLAGSGSLMGLPTGKVGCLAAGSF